MPSRQTVAVNGRFMVYCFTGGATENFLQSTRAPPRRDRCSQPRPGRLARERRQLPLRECHRRPRLRAWIRYLPTSGHRLPVRDPERPARHHRRYGSASRPLLRNERGVLVEPAESVRPTYCGSEAGKAIKALPTLKRFRHIARTS